MDMESYLVPGEYGEAELVEKRSRFIGQVWRVETEEEARERVEQVRKKYHDARHHCWCYLLREGGVLRYSDDGEPQGTAGQPMLNVFQKEGVANAVCVVTRYFGGILLGAGGLTRAYGSTAKLALDGAGLCRMRLWASLLVSCPYGLYERMRLLVEKSGGAVENADFGADGAAAGPGRGGVPGAGDGAVRRHGGGAGGGGDVSSRSAVRQRPPPEIYFLRYCRR